MRAALAVAGTLLLLGGYAVGQADADAHAQARITHAQAEADYDAEAKAQFAYEDGYADGWADALAEQPPSLAVCQEDEVQVWGTGTCWPRDDADYQRGYGWVPKAGYDSTTDQPVAS
jgi:hypothetical protein